MKATYTKQDEFTLIETYDYILVPERCFFSDELFDRECLTVSGEDKRWLAEIQEILEQPNINRYEFEFTFKRTSKKRFEFTLTRLHWPEMYPHYDEDEDEDLDAYVESKVLFKWVAAQPDWVLTEAVKRYSGYFDLKDAELSVLRPASIDNPF